MKQISIIGGGAWGRALACTFASKFKVTLYALINDPKIQNKKIEILHDLSKIKGLYMFLVVPAFAVREVCSKLQKVLSKDHIIIICSKGIEVNSGKLMSEVIEEFLPTNKLAMLAGPNFASEVSQNLPALTSIISNDLSLAKTLSKVFSMQNFCLLPSSNLVMAELFSSLKNVLALLCGTTRSLGLGKISQLRLLAQLRKKYWILLGIKEKQPRK